MQYETFMVGQLKFKGATTKEHEYKALDNRYTMKPAWTERAGFAGKVVRLHCAGDRAGNKKNLQLMSDVSRSKLMV